jgi:hypothetical protein
MDYGFNIKQASLYLLSLIISYFYALYLYIAFNKYFFTLRNHAILPVPEKRLYIAILGGFLLLLSEIW